LSRARRRLAGKAAGQIDLSGAAMALSHADRTGEHIGGYLKSYADNAW
jgi:hypothetical protein